MTGSILALYLIWLFFWGQNVFEPWQWHLLAITALGLCGLNGKLEDVLKILKERT